MTANHDDDGSEASGYDSNAAIENPRRSEPFLDRALSVLADARCRSLLDFLRDADRGVSPAARREGGVPVDGLAEFSRLVDELAAAAGGAGATPDGRERFAVEVHHVTLPKLRNAGFVEYDERSGSIRYHRHERFEAILERVDSVERWPTLPADGDVDEEETGDGAVEHEAVDDGTTNDGTVAAGAASAVRERWLELLADRRRRDALRVLAFHGEPVTLADLADEVAARERGAPLAEISPDDVLRVYLSLYHRHVPKLADAGVLAYDQDADLVRLATDATRLGAVLRALGA